MIDAVVEAIPWDKVGEAALGIGIAALTALGIEVGSRLLTGKGMFDHIQTAYAGIKNRLSTWIQQKGNSNVIIKRLVFVLQSIIGIEKKGMRKVRLAIFGETDDYDAKKGEFVRYKTNEVVTVEMENTDAEKLRSKKEIDAELDELGL